MVSWWQCHTLTRQAYFSGQDDTDNVIWLNYRDWSNYTVKYLCWKYPFQKDIELWQNYPDIQRKCAFLRSSVWLFARNKEGGGWWLGSGHQLPSADWDKLTRAVTTSDNSWHQMADGESCLEHKISWQNSGNPHLTTVDSLTQYQLWEAWVVQLNAEVLRVWPDSSELYIVRSCIPGLI